MKPLVSVICLCFNQASFVRECIESVFFQTYPHIELIVLDDASQDDSIANIEAVLKDKLAYQQASQETGKALLGNSFRIEFLKNAQNLGNCRTFNKGLSWARGKYVIDLAADDILLPDRISQQVGIFEGLSPDYGVIFSNAVHIDARGKVLGYHYPIGEAGTAQVAVPRGDIYKALFKGYFISTPTMMMRKSLLDDLGGYDEALTYEDFDFWVRSARTCLYHYQDEVTTQKRILKNSLSRAFYKKGNNAHLRSTLEVCKKAKQLNKNQDEDQALAICLKYHFRQVCLNQSYDLMEAYLDLMEEIDAKWGWRERFLRRASRMRLPLHRLYRFYRWIKEKGKQWQFKN